MALRGHVTQLIFLTTLIKFLLRKKVFSATCFFSAPISKCFVSFIILICNNFSFLVFISFIFASQFFCFECYFFLYKALNIILLLIFFIFLVSYILILFFHFNMYISLFLLLCSFFSVSHFFVCLFFYC